VQCLIGFVRRLVLLHPGNEGGSEARDGSANPGGSTTFLGLGWGCLCATGLLWELQSALMTAPLELVLVWAPPPGCIAPARSQVGESPASQRSGKHSICLASGARNSQDWPKVFSQRHRAINSIAFPGHALAWVDTSEAAHR